MDQKLSTIMEFPDTVTRTEPPINESSPPQTYTISLVYTLRGVILENNLFYLSQWENPTNPYKRRFVWYKCDFTSSPEIAPVEQGEVLTVARDRGPNGILTVYVRNDVRENIEKVSPPEYLRVPPL
jgi:hypothetical protein